MTCWLLAGENEFIQADKPVFQKTEVPCLYRYSSNGVYYARVKHEGKQKRTALETTDKTVAKRKLGDLQRDLGKVDPSHGHVTLRELRDRYLLAVQNQAQTTVYRKKHIIDRLMHDFSEGTDTQHLQGLAQITRFDGVYHIGRQCVTNTFVKQGFASAHAGTRRPCSAPTSQP